MAFFDFVYGFVFIVFILVFLFCKKFYEIQ